MRSIVRASLGAMTTKADIQALLHFLHNQFISEAKTAPLLEPSKDSIHLPLREAYAIHGMANEGYLKDL